MKLTNREIDVLRLIAFEKTTPEIARHLYISKETVKSHRRKLFQKMEVSNIAGLVRKGFESHIL